MKQIRNAVALALFALAFSASAQQAARKPYIVQLVDAPVASYAGGVSGYAATRPASGTRLDVNAQNVQNYISFLSAKQSQAVAAVPGAIVTYRFKLALNGFAAFLTDAEAAKLAASMGVKSVSEDVPLTVDTSYTPTFLGLNQVPQGAWARHDASGRAIKGEGVIIAHLDSGVWPENPSFSDKVDAQGNPIPSHEAGTVVYDPLPAGRWNGTCQAGEGFTAAQCNNKLIGARYFNDTWKLAISIGARILWAGEYLDSPRDADGHGSHTLSTSGGNENTQAFIHGSSFRISGMAPRARVAAYKVCYTPQDANGVPGQGSCFQGDSIAATEAAVADGVDVINFSVGGSTTSVQDPVEVAFLNAALAGVFVAASSGNSNVPPANAPTAAHLSPWLMTVGNSTHDRFTQAIVTLGDGYQAAGTSFQTSGLSTRGLIWSRAAGFDAVPVTSNQALCLGPADNVAALLDPAKVAGKIVVCERGSNALVNKVENARTAGATGVIILNTPASANTTPTISAVLPVVHLDVSHHAPLTTYMTNEPNAVASFSAGAQVPGVVAPVMAGTSSRGPNRADPDVLKPDITAPGTDIIAAYTNQDITPAQRLQIIAGTLVPGPGAEMISGTSMASPHVAGSAALLRQANPTWSPFAIKSALMTSAAQTVKLADGSPDPDRWGYGAGHLNPNVALDTKVVYDQSPADHINYYLGAVGGRSLNLASLTHSAVVGVGSLTRTLTNKGTAPVTYSATASLPGFTVTVSPATVTIPAGGTASYNVTMRRVSAANDQWVFGDVTWSNTSGQATLRSPLAARNTLFVVPPLVTDVRAIGTKVFTIGTGYDGTVAVNSLGLLANSTVPSSVGINQRRCLQFNPMPAGVRIIRAQLFDSETEGGAGTDLDLLLQRFVGGTWTTVSSSGGVTSNELVTVSNPVAGASYRVCVDGYAPANGSEAAFLLNYWVLGPANPGTLRAFGPTRVKVGGTGSVAMSWNVPAGKRYLGLVDFANAAGASPTASTSVFIDTVPVPATLVQDGGEKLVRSKPER